MPRHKPKHKKIQKLEDDDGWTHVVRGPRLPSGELGRAVTGDIGDKISQIRAASRLSLEQLRSKYAKSQQHWEEDPLRHRFEQIFVSQVVSVLPDITIDTVLVLGLGVLATDNMDSSSMHQLVLFEYWLAFLRTKYAIPNVSFQDPYFCANDQTFLQELGYSVVDDPEAYLLLTPTTFLFTPYLPWEITHTFLYAALPALFVGNDFTFQDSLKLSRERQTIRQSPVIQKYYSSCKKVSLDCRKEWEALVGPKHARWLADMFMYWSSGNELSIKEQGNEQSDNFRFRAGPGEWRSDGYVFDPMLWTKIQDARRQRALQPE